MTPFKHTVIFIMGSPPPPSVISAGRTAGHVDGHMEPISPALRDNRNFDTFPVMCWAGSEVSLAGPVQLLSALANRKSPLYGH